MEQTYPGHPYNYQAGWDYTLQTHLLPEQGNGTYELHAIATDRLGQAVTLGTRTIVCDNANAVKPFGVLPQDGS